MMGTIYIVATPIGNLDDITFRAIKTLKESDLILTEDTRVTRKLLDHYDIQVDTLTYNQHSNPNNPRLISILQEGGKVALVTDAGTPGVADPGNELINFLLLQLPDLKVVPIPGASSITTALSACGFNTNNFMFIGFWPKKKAKKMMERIKTIDCPVVFFESPFRIKKTIDLLIKEFPEKRIFIGQELTKLHERIFRGSLNEAKLRFEIEQKELGRVKGELVCILEA